MCDRIYFTEKRNKIKTAHSVRKQTSKQSLKGSWPTTCHTNLYKALINILFDCYIHELVQPFIT